MILLFSILCSTIIFVLFTLFGKYKVNNLQAIVSNYFVAGTLGWLIYDAPDAPIDVIQSWSFWPLLIGVMFITLFQLMAEVTQRNGVNVVSVTVKMSVAIPVLSGLLFYAESLTALNYVGILIAFAAVYAINKKSGEKTAGKVAWFGLTALFLGSGLLDSFLKVIEHGIVDESHLAYFTSTAFGVAGILGVIWIAIRVFILKSLKLDRNSWLWGLVLGIPNYGSIYFLMRALNSDVPSAILFPINNVGIVALSALVALLAFRERITKWRFIGLVLAVVAIVLMAI